MDESKHQVVDEAALVERLCSGETWGQPGLAVEHIETHAAHVFLVGDRAYKIKRWLKLPYLDFSTRDKREAVLKRELEINRSYAPELYLDVIAIWDEPVLEMRRFDSHALLSNKLESGHLGDDLARALASTVANAHLAAPASDIPGSEIMAGLAHQLKTAFAAAPDLFERAEAAQFCDLHHADIGRLTDLLDRRSDAGLVRRCHGDLHCGNIIVENGAPMLFDAIEFSDRIATVDVLYDLAFLLMDLIRHGQRRGGNVLLNSYLNLRRAQEDLSGLAALPLFLATRAGVRALVTADLIAEQAQASSELRRDAQNYFRAASSFLAHRQPELICIGGLSGTGKSTLARSISPAVGTPPGALHIRSDVERKLLAGVAETELLPPQSYTREASIRVYETIYQRAGRALAAGRSVVLDAVFAAESERAAAEWIAKRAGAKFGGLWLEAPANQLKSRVTARRNDASDASSDVVEAQLGYDLGELRWTRIDASGNAEDTYARVMRARQAMV